MSTQIVRSGFDTWATLNKPSLAYPRASVLQLRAGVAEAFYWFRNPAPRGATITSATLTLRAKGASTGTRVVTAQRVTASWLESTLTWNARPAATTTSQATATIGAVGDGAAIELNVTAIAQAWANGTPNYGLKITTDASTMFGIHGLASYYKPTLTVVWEDRPAKPTNLRPSSAATSLEKPHLVFDYLDVSGDTSLSAVQVQIDDAADMVGAWDSGVVETTEAGLDLATTSFPGIPLAGTRYWRVRARDGAGLWSVWSDVVPMSRFGKAPLSITNMGAGVAYETSPPIFWSMSGQTRYRVLIYDLGRRVPAPVHDSGERLGNAQAYTVPFGSIVDGKTYRVEVRGWDNVVREGTPGDPTYSFATADFVVDVDPTVDPPSATTAVQQGVTPWINVSWTRSTTPDGFVLYRDGRPLASLDPADVFVSGTTYRYVDPDASPNRDHTYTVRAIVNGKQSPNGPAAVVNYSVDGVWLLDADRGIDAVLWGDDEGTWQTTDEAGVYTPLGASEVVRIVSGLRGLEGSISGLLMDGFGRTFAQIEADLYRIKERPTQTVRLVLGDSSIRVLIGNLRVSPHPRTKNGQLVKGVSFDFWQVGALPFDAEV